MGNRKKLIMLAVGCAVTGVALWYSTRAVNFGDMVGALRRFNWWWMLPGFALFYYSMYLRAVRWGLLFRPNYQLSGRQLFSPMMIGFAFNSILPGRVGEFWRAWLAGRHYETGVPYAMATVVAERILDAVTLLGLLALSLAILPPIDPNVRYTFGKIVLDSAKLNDLIRSLIVLSAIMTIGVVIFMIPAVQRLGLAILDRMTFLPARVRGIMRHLIEQFARGFHALHSPSVLARVIGQSLVLWILVAVSNQVLAYGFGIPMNSLQAMALVTLIGIWILIPAAPGYWGLYEYGTLFSLRIMGLGRDDSERMAYALTIHLIQYIPIVAIGLYCAWRSQVRPIAAAPAEKSA